MSGLDTLIHDGLDMTDGYSTTRGTAELLEWHCVAGGHLPDADITVLLWWTDHAGITDWERGWWDGEDWRLAESGGVCAGRVTHWAEPEGPAGDLVITKTDTGEIVAVTRQDADGRILEVLAEAPQTPNDQHKGPPQAVPLDAPVGPHREGQ